MAEVTGGPQANRQIQLCHYPTKDKQPADRQGGKYAGETEIALSVSEFIVMTFYHNRFLETKPPSHNSGARQYLRSVRTTVRNGDTPTQ